MTIEQTVHDRVRQAILRDEELTVQMMLLKETLLTAKQAEDSVRKTTEFSEKMEALKKQHEAKLAEAKAVYDRDVAKALAPLGAAQAKYNAAVAKAQATFGQAEDQATAAYSTDSASVTRTREGEIADAKAAVHRAQSEVASLATTIDQYRANMKEKLGINMANLMG